MAARSLCAAAAGDYGFVHTPDPMVNAMTYAIQSSGQYSKGGILSLNCAW